MQKECESTHCEVARFAWSATPRTYGRNFFEKRIPAGNNGKVVNNITVSRHIKPAVPKILFSFYVDFLLFFLSSFCTHFPIAMFLVSLASLRVWGKEEEKNTREGEKKWGSRASNKGGQNLGRILRKEVSGI